MKAIYSLTGIIAFVFALAACDGGSPDPPPPPPPPPEATFEGLGFLAGGRLSVAADISADGSVVVGTAGNSTDSDEAFRWVGGAVDDQSGVMTGLGFLPGGSFSKASDVSADGSVVVGRGKNAQDNVEAFRWVRDPAGGESGEMQGLGTPRDGQFPSIAYGVSGDGSIVVGQAESSLSGTLAFVWEDGNMVSLPTFSGGVMPQRADAISSDGSMVVGEAFGGQSFLGFRRSRGSLEVLESSPGGNPIFPEAVSADGLVIVGRARNLNGRLEAIRWENGASQGLGILPGHRSSEASAVSGDGQVIVGQGRNENGLTAFIWTPFEGMRNLKTVLESEYNLDLAGWTLVRNDETEPRVSARGDVIVGSGLNPDGDVEAWRVFLGAPVGSGELSAVGHAPEASSDRPQTATWNVQPVTRSHTER